MAWDTPIGYSTHYSFPKYAIGANPGADALNENLIEAIDTKIYEAYQSAGSLTALLPIKIVSQQISIEYEDNLILSLNNKLDTAQNIKTTGTPQFTRIGIGGVADEIIPLKVYGAAKVTGDLTVDGNFYIGGNINQVNVVDLDVADHAIRLNKNGDNTTALDGGVEMLGTNNAVIASVKYNGSAWLSDIHFDLGGGKVYKIGGTEVLSSTTLGATVVNSSLTSIGTLSHDLNIANTKVYKINGTTTLSATALGANVVTSSLTAVGTLTTGVWQATVINGQYLNYNNTNLKVTANQINTIQDISATSSPAFAKPNFTQGYQINGVDFVNNAGYFVTNLIPNVPDTYDLGSSTKLWRKGWLSELEAVVFAENTITLLGGWFYVTKNQGTLIADVDNVQTQINFGMAMTPNDFIVFRNNNQVEYMQIGTLVSGTTYNVTRNKDGTGANNWTAGTPFAVLGYNGDGRIEFNAYDTPRISIIKQGTAYNAQTELIRIGDLNGMPGYSTQTVGAYYGDANSYFKYDQTNGAVFKGNGSGLTSINGGNIQTGTVTLNQLNFTPVQTSNVVASINASAEGITINANRLNLTGVLAVGTAANDVNTNVTTISGDKIRSGVIQSNNWTTTTGSYYDLINGTITLGGSASPNFSVSNSGLMISKSGAIGNWTISNNKIEKVTYDGSKWLYLGLYSDFTNYTTGLQVKAEQSSITKVIVNAGSYNDGGAARYGFSIWDAINSQWLMNVGYGGPSNNLSALMAGWNFDYQKLYNNNTRLEASASLKGLGVSDGTNDLIKIGEFTGNPPDVSTDYTSQAIASGDFATTTKYNNWVKGDDTKFTHDASGYSGYCLKCIATTDAGQWYQTATLTQAGVLSGISGKTVEVSFWAKKGPEWTGAQSLKFTIWTSVYTPTTWITAATYNCTPTSTSWTQYKFMCNIPSGAYQIKYELLFFELVNDNRASCFVDEIQMRLFDKTFVYVNNNGLNVYTSPLSNFSFLNGVLNINANSILLNNKPIGKWLGNHPTGTSSSNLPLEPGCMFSIGSTYYIVNDDLSTSALN
ncbi:MAG: hypothetical protein AB1633_00205 [Elusimicrobiota bacterium]